MVQQIDLIVRCFNEMPHVARTLSVLTRLPWARLTFFDSGSTDGSLEEAAEAGAEVVRIPPGGYVPGRILNEAMARTKSAVVGFVNADAVPLSERAVTLLVEACEQGAAASFGRQVPRHDAAGATKLDYGRAFPDDPDGNGFRHFFSMAASAIRRDVWEALPFDDALRFSEDVDWTWRVRATGREVRYVPGAVFEHSHDYDAQALWRRMRGEGMADAAIYHVGHPDFLRAFALPVSAQLIRDARAGHLSPVAGVRRVVAQTARWRGRIEGVSLPWTSRPALRPASPRFTVDGEPASEEMVHRTVRSATALIQATLGERTRGILLLGGYAYGEGAVELRNGTPVIHNDLDFVAVFDTPQQARRARAPCAKAALEASAAVSATVDVWAVSRRELEYPKGRLLWADAALRGVRVVHGDPSLVAPLGRLTARSIRRGEIGRLLANRATGVALSRLAWLATGEGERPRAHRHWAKAWLALGDALLIVVDRYEATSAERAASLQRLSKIGSRVVGEISDGYARALEYRKAPELLWMDGAAFDRERDTLWRAHASLEAHRLGETPPLRPLDYARAAARRMPELDDVSSAGRLLGGMRAAALGAAAWRASFWHPRETLARAAVALAYEPDLEAALALAEEYLGADVCSVQSVFEALESIRDLGA